ncbi:MAG: four helix bundle protein [Bacteroidetes bacterium]|nr:four helix bundle protein [Bacteroidota bacterium]
MAKRIRSHKDVKIWQMSMDLVDDTYKLTKTFPGDERYFLT